MIENPRNGALCFVSKNPVENPFFPVKSLKYKFFVEFIGDVP